MVSRLSSVSTSKSSTIVQSPPPLIRTLFFGLSDKEIFFIICVFGAIIQTAFILHRYFSYEILTLSHVGVPDTTLVPSISICFPIIDAINFTKLTFDYPELINELGIRPVIKSGSYTNSLRTSFTDSFLQEFILNKLKIDQLWRLMYTYSDIFGKAITFKITVDSFIEIPCTYGNYFNYDSYCYSFNCNADYNSTKPVVSDTVDLYKKLTAQEVVRISVYQTFFRTLNNYWITLMTLGQYPRGLKPKWESQAAYNVTRKHTFFFYSITNRLLKAPYPTNCFNYSDLGFVSKAEMEDKCQIDLAIKKIGSPLPSNVLERPLAVPFGLSSFQENQNNSTFLSIVSDIVDHCYKQTERPDCVKTIYVPMSRTPLPIPGNFTEITVEQVSDPVYIINIVPKTSLLDLIISIGSVLGTWLGFSIAYSIPQMAGILGYKFLKLPQRKKTQGYQIKFKGSKSDIFEPEYLNYNHIYGIDKNGPRYSRNDPLFRRPLNHKFPPFYVYYNQQSWPLVYDAKVRPWWYR